MSQTSEMSKTDGVSRRYIKEHTFTEMERLPTSNMYRYRLVCRGCEKACALLFCSPVVLSSAFVAKRVAVFYSLCKSLEEVESSVPPDGRQLPLFDANNGEN